MNAASAVSFELNALFQSSVLVVDQLMASAKGPVTCATFAVSFAASVSPSIGKPSPNVAYTPVAIVVHFAKSCSLVASFARLPTASVAWSVSPKIAAKSMNVSLPVSAEYPIVVNAVSTLPIAIRVSRVASAVERNAVVSPTAAVTPALSPATAPFIAPLATLPSLDSAPVELVDESPNLSTDSLAFLESSPSSSTESPAWSAVFSIGFNDLSAVSPSFFKSFSASEVSISVPITILPSAIYTS